MSTLIQDYETEQLGLEVDNELKELTTIIKNVDTIVVSNESPLDEPAVTMLSYQLNTSIERAVVPYQYDKIDAGEYIPPERTKKIESFLSKLVRFIKKVIKKVMSFIFLLIRKYFFTYAKIYNLNYLFSLFGEGKRQRKIFNHVLENGLDDLNKAIQKNNRDGNEFINPLEEQVYDKCLIFLTKDNLIKNQLPTLTGASNLTNTLYKFIHDETMIDVDIIDAFGNNKDVIVNSKIENNYVVSTYNTMKYEDNGEYVTDIIISDKQKTKDKLVKTMFVNIDLTRLNAFETSFRETDGLSAYARSMDIDKDVDVESILEKIRVKLNLDANNMNDYQAAQLLIVSAVNLFKMILTAGRTVMTELNSIYMLLNTIDKISESVILSEEIYKK